MQQTYVKCEECGYIDEYLIGRVKRILSWCKEMLLCVECRNEYRKNGWIDEE